MVLDAGYERVGRERRQLDTNRPIGVDYLQKDARMRRDVRVKHHFYVLLYCKATLYMPLMLQQQSWLTLRYVPRQ